MGNKVLDYLSEDKMLDYAKAIKSDLAYAHQSEEDYLPFERDMKVIDWLIEQAERAKMYKTTLMRIGAKQKPPSSMIANSVLLEADQRFNK